MRSVRLRFAKIDSARYISHLDLTRCMTRAFRRTDIPLWYTEGFNPHPYLVFGLSLPLGVEGYRETLDIRLDNDEYPDERVLAELNRVSVPGIRFDEITAPVHKAAEITSAEYEADIVTDGDGAILAQRMNEIVAAGDVSIEKKNKRKEIKLLNVCESMKAFSAQATDKGAHLHFILPAGGEFNINPVLFVTKLLSMTDAADLPYRIARLRFLLPDGTEFR